MTTAASTPDTLPAVPEGPAPGAIVNETERPEDTVRRYAQENLALKEALASDYRGDGYRRALTAEQVGALMSDLNPNRVATRNVQGRDLSYLEAHDVRATLTRIFGFGGWSLDVIESKILDIRDDGRQGTYPQGHQRAGQPKTPYVLAYARVCLTIHNIGPAGQDVSFTETAIGTNDGWTIGDVADNAIKSAASDAMKRCATNLGTAFGLSLYANGSRQDTIRVIFEPEQKALLEQWRAEREALRNPEADAQVAHALGGERQEPQA